MKKKALLAALLAMTLLLSSCALVVKDHAVDAATVILSGKCGNLILVEVGVGVFALLYVLIAKLVWKANAQKEAPADAN